MYVQTIIKRGALSRLGRIKRHIFHYSPVCFAFIVFNWKPRLHEYMGDSLACFDYRAQTIFFSFWFIWLSPNKLGSKSEVPHFFRQNILQKGGWFIGRRVGWGVNCPIMKLLAMIGNKIKIS